MLFVVDFKSLLKSFLCENKVKNYHSGSEDKTSGFKNKQTLVQCKSSFFSFGRLASACTATETSSSVWNPERRHSDEPAACWRCVCVCEVDEGLHSVCWTGSNTVTSEDWNRSRNGLM